MFLTARNFLKHATRSRAVSIVKERAMSLSNMSTGMKATVWMVYGLLASIAILIMFHGYLEHTREVSIGGVQLGLGILVAAAPISFITISMLVTGAILANAVSRWSTVVFLFLTLILFTNQLASLRVSPTASHPRLLTVLWLATLLPIVFLLVLAAILAKRIRPRYIAALCGAYLFLSFCAPFFLARESRFQNAAIAPFWILVMIFNFVYPLLLVVGFDLVELGSLLCKFAADQAQRVSDSKWMVVVLCVGSIANLGLAIRSIPHSHAAWLAGSAGGFVALSAVLIWVFQASADPLDHHHPHLGFWTVLAFAAAVLYLAYVPSISERDKPFPVYNDHGVHRFAVVFPANWTIRPNCGRSAAFVKQFESVRACVDAAGDNAVIRIFSLSRSMPPIESLNQLLTDGPDYPATPFHSAANGPYDFRTFDVTLVNQRTHKSVHFIVKHLPPPDPDDPQVAVDWYFLVGSESEIFNQVSPKFEAVLDSWTLGNLTEPDERMTKLIYAIWGPVATLSLLWLFFRRPSPRRPTVALLATIATIVILLNAHGFEFAEESEIALRRDLFHTAQFAIALLSLALTFGFFARHRVGDVWKKALNLALTTNIAVLLAGVLLAFYRFGSAGGERSNFFKGAFILLALSFDVATSGGITNKSTRWFPRNSRILLFTGYVLVVAIFVYAFFNETVMYHRLTPFDSEQYVERGILVLGLSFILVMYAYGAGALLRERREADRLRRENEKMQENEKAKAEHAALESPGIAGEQLGPP